MRKNTHSANVCGNALNTLAQSETDNNRNIPVIIVGDGSELSSDKVLKGRAKRKLISNKMALSLIDVAKRKEETKLVKSFWNTYYCQKRIVSYEGRIYGKYCKNRYCTLCSSIRKAEIINKYYPVLSSWGEPYFVTLTIKACKARSLKKMFDGLIRGFKQINAKYRKNNQRDKGIRLVGVKSLECNFNPVKNTYNPHLHLIVASKAIAETVIKEWLVKWTPKFATRPAQDYRPIHNLQTALIETIKYGSKIFTEPDVNNKSNNRGSGNIHVAALYNIFDAMKGLRIFERFGFDLPKSVTKERAGARIVAEYGEWVYIAKYADWVNTENELTLSGYAPAKGLVNLLEHGIDFEME